MLVALQYYFMKTMNMDIGLLEPKNPDFVFLDIDREQDVAKYDHCLFNFRQLYCV